MTMLAMNSGATERPVGLDKNDSGERPFVDIANVSFSYRDHEVLQKIAFEVEEGHCVAVLGNNGAGKSTLVKCLCGILSTSGATVYVNGQDILMMERRAAARHVAYVSQFSQPQHTTVFDMILMGRKPHIKWDLGDEDLAIVARVLNELNLEPLQFKMIDEISGGELQKVMLARALVQQPRLLLLDEPTSNLDPANQYEVLELVTAKARTSGISVIMVMHDLNLALRYCDRFLFIKDREVYGYGDLASVTADCLKEVYGIPFELTRHKEIPVAVPFP